MAFKDDELDTLIDDVARRMTAGDPGAAFTSSVLARLDERRPVWRPVRSWRPALAGLAAAAVLVVAAAVYRSNSPAAGPAGPTMRPEPGATASNVQLTPDATPADREPDATRQIAPAPKVRLRPDATKFVAPIPSGIDALTVPSIAVDSIAETPLPQLDSLQSDPLTIAPIIVTPLESGDDTQRRFE
ncbi:MAG: hypothetical protein LAO77_07035 [Acidobacteriia bacterium]|nr:hypothetical protein [Terriglobia bacterium]